MGKKDGKLRRVRIVVRSAEGEIEDTYEGELSRYGLKNEAKLLQETASPGSSVRFDYKNRPSTS